ncbi:hypothetical protein MAH1_16490 [Sessilibacter sp. MAH1]
MLKRVLTYFVLSLVVLQFSVAMGDAHQLHQSGAEHLVFDDVHQHDDEHVSSTLDDQNLNPELPASEKWDCHHCCHCHGHLCPAILISIEYVHVAKLSSPVSDYAESTFPETYETFLRPPKA